MNKHVKAMTALIVYCLSGALGAQTQVLHLSEDRRLEAVIGLAAMNRIAVANDRIVNVFGDEGTFTSQSDEQSGQLFIKLSPENGDTPLALTLITENGLTQDLNLIPTQSEATTIILKPAKGSSTQHPSEVASLATTSGPLEPWIQALKQAVLGTLPETTEKGQRRTHTPSGFKVQYQKSYEVPPFKVRVWRIRNTSALTRDCLEQDFYQAGDRALSLEKRRLAPGGQGLLYIVGSA